MDNNNNIQKTILSEVHGQVKTVTPNGIIVSPYPLGSAGDITVSQNYNKYDRYKKDQHVVIVTAEVIRPATNDDLARLEYIANREHKTPPQPKYIRDKRVTVETVEEFDRRKALEEQEALKASRDHNDDDDDAR